jgi:hypothetical protein
MLFVGTIVASLLFVLGVVALKPEGSLERAVILTLSIMAVLVVFGAFSSLVPWADGVWERFVEIISSLFPFD